ncbi:hypothetical protein AB6A40_003646 [Gnathostoma spinigerum]|uniref:Uncharacterized protein n=1 Tax=Gnathostoma spinigerum TaxID=75299 RepID=A0ABD6EJS2_9BILA
MPDGWAPTECRILSEDDVAKHQRAAKRETPLTVSSRRGRRVASDGELHGVSIFAIVRFFFIKIPCGCNSCILLDGSRSLRYLLYGPSV